MPNIVKLTVLGLALFVAIASLLPFLRREAWWIRVFDVPRLQMLSLALLSSALTLVPKLQLEDRCSKKLQLLIPSPLGRGWPKAG